MFQRLDNDLVQFNDSVLRIRMIYRGSATHTYTVALEKGKWPTDSEVISLCDGNDGNVRADFGGNVLKVGTTATVDVYVD